MHKIIEVKPLKNYKVWIKFSDSVEGEVDLSHLAGKGVFSKWNDIDYFNSVYIDKESHTLCWEGEIDLCPDNLYAKVLNVNPLAILEEKIVVKI